jgi:hypothetical protein
VPPWSVGSRHQGAARLVRGPPESMTLGRGPLTGRVS